MKIITCHHAQLAYSCGMRIPRIAKNPTKNQNMKSVTFTLVDSFNSCDLSMHYTLVSALKAQKTHSKRLKKWGVFVTYIIRRSDDRCITRDEMLEAQLAAGNL